MADTENTYILRLFLVLAAALAGVALSFFSGRLFLKSPVAQRAPRPILCTVLWSLPTIFFDLAVPLVADDFSTALSFLVAIPLAALLGMFFGTCFVLLTRLGITAGYWQQRLVVGAVIGLALALLVGLGMHQIFTGWGGPGGGNFHRPDVLEVALFFSWLIPVFAIVGVATPRQAVMPNSSLNPDLQPDNAASRHGL